MMEREISRKYVTRKQPSCLGPKLCQVDWDFPPEKKRKLLLDYTLLWISISASPHFVSIMVPGVALLATRRLISATVWQLELFENQNVNQVGLEINPISPPVTYSPISVQIHVQAFWGKKLVFLIFRTRITLSSLVFWFLKRNEACTLFQVIAPTRKKL